MNLSDIWGMKEDPLPEKTFWQKVQHIAPFERRKVSRDIELGIHAVTNIELSDACLYVHHRLIAMNEVLENQPYFDEAPRGDAYKHAVCVVFSLNRHAYNAILNLDSAWFCTRPVNRLSLMNTADQMQSWVNESLAIAVIKMYQESDVDTDEEAMLYEPDK